MVIEKLVEPLAFLCIAFGIVLILFFFFYWGFKFSSLNEDEELRKLRKEVKVKDEQILGLRAELDAKNIRILELRLGGSSNESK